MKNNRLIYIPFGGAGEIGMNMYVYGYGPKGKERYIVVDTGVLFPNMETAPGVDLVFPDYSWLIERKSRVEAIFLTHGHLDHLGAVSFVSEDLKVPVYARPLSHKIALDRVYEYGGNSDLFHSVGPLPEITTAGPFKVSYAPISHSIPESSSLIIDTPAGRIIHTGDFKIDSNPVIGDPFDEDLWEDTTREKILALVCDSTNALNEMAGRSESTVSPNLVDLIEVSEGMVIATTFASHIARIYQVSRAAEQCDRNVVLLGRAMNRFVNLALDEGILDEIPNLIPVEAAFNLPRNSLVVLATGSQGEPRAATAQLSTGQPFKGIKVKRGDTIIYSSKTIPGNEISVSTIQNRFAKLGVEVVDDTSDLYHVSGHPNIPDLMRLHRLVSPELVIPMHGEYRHIQRHADIAINAGFEALVAPDGSPVDILRKVILKEEKENIGKLYIDGKVLIGNNDRAINERIIMAINGQISVFLKRNSDRFDREDILVQTLGLSRFQNDEFEKELKEKIFIKLDQASNRSLSRHNEIKKMVGRLIRQYSMKFYGKSPLIHVVVR